MKKIYYLLAIALMSWSCTREIAPDSSGGSQESIPTNVRLGKKLENPYSVKNMRIALNELKKTNKSINGAEENDIAATHYYVKFNPATLDDVSKLKLDSTLILYPYPLDYEILNEENTATNNDEITPYYASVPVGKSLPEDVGHEILEELFIPDENKDNDTKTNKGVLSNDSFVRNLVDKSLELTDNSEDDIKNPTQRSSNWRPAGRITMEDNSLNRSVGVEGLKVKARRWFTTHLGFADANGNFVCDGTFRRRANYSFDWERYNFKIRGEMIGIIGPKQKGNWNSHFVKTDQKNYYATIFRASFHYYYKDIQGLRRPPENSFWKTQLKIRPVDRSDGNTLGNANPFRNTLGLGNWIKIYDPSRESSSIYGTTIHELAHASHWNLSKSFSFSFVNTSDVVAESWANGVQWALTRMVYPNYDKTFYSRRKYTAVVRDLIDGHKRVSNIWYVDDSGSTLEREKTYEDQVSGYTIRQIEDALINTTSWDLWRMRIINNPSQENTFHPINAAFSYWNSNILSDY